MESLLLALRLVMPMCAYMVIGYMLQRRHFFTQEAMDDLNKLLFKVSLPLSIVKSIYSSDLRGGGNWNVILFAVISTILLNIVCAVVMPHLDSSRRRIPVMIQGVAKSNYVLIGLSMVTMVYGDDIGMAGVMLAVMAPLNNTLSTIVFEAYRGGKISAGQFIRKIITNPLVLSGLIGIALNMSGIRIPTIIMNDIVGKLGNCATPMALLMMGAGFSFEYASQYKRQLSIVTLGRLIITPLIEIPIIIWMGFRGADLLTLVISAATPTAINSYSTAVSMGGDGELAGAIVAITSICSVATIFLWVSIISALGLL